MIKSKKNPRGWTEAQSAVYQIPPGSDLENKGLNFHSTSHLFNTRGEDGGQEKPHVCQVRTWKKETEVEHWSGSSIVFQSMVSYTSPPSKLTI